ncbi:MAG: TetR family transcriptional regulator [Bifidobacteriaceae bacterium]|jgi:AcrR family transcriptional regulator|nr:TetR family transcriptional regulator [Bifidobacteriaceae bacterium]
MPDKPVSDPPRRGGRRPGPDSTAQPILDEARKAFATKGYAHTSLRAVGEAAGVDPAMIAYFFGSKAGLFQAAINVPISLDMPAMVEFRSSQAEPAERIARLFFSLWGDPPVAQALTAIILEAGLNSAAGQALRRFMFAYVGGPIVRELKVGDQELRLRLAVGLMLSVALQRRFDRACVFAHLTSRQLVEVVTPLLRHILTAPMPPGLPPGEDPPAAPFPFAASPPPDAAAPDTAPPSPEGGDAHDDRPDA